MLDETMLAMYVCFFCMCLCVLYKMSHRPNILLQSIDENVHILPCNEVFPFLLGHLLDKVSVAEVSPLQASETPLKMKAEYEMTNAQWFYNANGKHSR